MYLGAIVGDHRDVAELVAWADTNSGRQDWSEQIFRDAGIAIPARFPIDGLAAAIDAHQIDRVIITSPDFTHAGYIAQALDAGADVIVEKPLTTSVEGVRLIHEAVERSGRDLTITFNYRYSPRNMALKRALAAGEIGQVTSVHFEWLLDTARGADYFRRWHRDKRNSGGLLIHKASHHFDLVNWWLGDVPTRVFASGGLRFYGAANARARGLGERPPRGTTDSPLRDAFCLDLRRDPVLKGLYLDQENYDGYLRDRDVFTDPITIEDNLSLIVDYATGASMSYSLNAHAPWEGYVIGVNGTEGRAELRVVERGAVLTDAEDRVEVLDASSQRDLEDHGDLRPVGEQLLVQRHFEAAREVGIESTGGGHGGGDARLLKDVFRGVADDELGCAATFIDGVSAVSVGLAGNRSLQSGQAVKIAELELGVQLTTWATSRRA